MSNKIDYVTMTDDEIKKLIDGDISIDELKDISAKIGINAETQHMIDDTIKRLYKLIIKTAKGM